MMTVNTKQDPWLGLEDLRSQGVRGVGSTAARRRPMERGRREAAHERS